MKKNVIITIGLLLLFFAYTYWDYLPPRTPLKIARIHSGLNISNKSQLVSFEEKYSFTGEGFIYIRFMLNDVEISRIIKECINKKYTILSEKNLLKDNLSVGFKLRNKNIFDIKSGYYHLIGNIKEISFTITVIDDVKNELIIYTIF